MSLLRNEDKEKGMERVTWNNDQREKQIQNVIKKENNVKIYVKQRKQNEKKYNTKKENTGKHVNREISNKKRTLKMRINCEGPETEISG